MKKASKTTVLLLISFLIYSSLAFSCNSTNSSEASKTRVLAKSADDAAQAQISIANLLKTAQQNGEIGADFVKEAKGYLQQINLLNDQVIALARGLTTSPIPADEQSTVLDLLGKISNLVQNLNSSGLLHIKNEATKIAFSGFIAALQGAVTTVTVIFTQK